MKRILALLLCIILVFLVGCSSDADKDSTSSKDLVSGSVELDPDMTWGRWLGLYYDNLDNLAEKRPDSLAVAYGYLLDEKVLGDMLKASGTNLTEWEKKYGYLLEASYVSELFAESSTTYKEWKQMYGFTFRNETDQDGATVVKPTDKPAAPENQDPTKHPTVYTPWQAVPLVTAEMLKKGHAGGEGSQWPLFITMSATDPDLGFMGTDVGGMYRTLDGGDNWAMSTVGIYSSAATGIAIDPKNANRVICVGVNSTYWPVNGLYLSTNKGDEWKAVYTYALTNDEHSKICGHRDFRHQVAYDESSYDSKLGYCTTIYWCKETKSYGKGESNAPRLYKSTDGGSTWKVVNTSADIGGGEVYVSPAKGYVYIANSNGVFRSTDGGKSFKKVLNIPSYGMDVISTRKNNVYVSTRDGMYLSENNGETFKKISVSGYPTVYPARVRVSPANPDRMVLQDDHLTGIGQYSSSAYYSHDGGKVWKKSDIDSSESFIPYNVRQTVFAWSCKDPNVCVSTGGDMIMRSTNGAAKFVWAGDGYNGSCATSITVNANDPRLMAVGNQDYNGAYSTDAGKTWKYIDWCEYGWGGYSYGAYVIDDKHVVAVVKYDNVMNISYTTDGANTVNRTGIKPATNRVYGAYGKNDIVFAGDYRSTNKGVTWKKMSNCDAVYTYSKDGTLYGVNSAGAVVSSKDYGESWSTIGSVPEGATYLDFDHDGNRLMVLAQKNKVYTMPAEGGRATLLCNFSSMNDVTGDSLDIRNLAVDHDNSDVIYVCSARGVYACASAVLRSVDGGKTWVNLSRNPGDGSQGPDGARDISNMAINPVTRELFVIGGCRGMYKMALPAKK